MRRGLGSGVAVALLVLAGLPAALPFLGPTARAFTPHAPIWIEGDAEFTAANGVTGGNGTLADPYLIEGWDIDAPYTYGIYLANTRAAFVIRNVFVHSAFGYGDISFGNVSDARLENATAVSDIMITDSVHVSVSRVFMSRMDLYVSTSADLRFENITLAGVRIAGSSGVVFQYNDVQPWYVGVYFTGDPNDPSRRGTNYTIAGNRFAPDTSWVAHMSGVDGATIAGNELDRVGLEVNDARSVTIRNNTIHDLPPSAAIVAALRVIGSQDVQVSGNDIRDAANPGLYIETSHNLTVTGNNLTNVTSGVYLWDSTNATLAANRITGGGILIRGYDLPFFVTHTFGPDNVVQGLPFLAYTHCTDVTIDGVAAGQVFVADCRRVHIRGLTISGVEMGIKLAGVDDALIEGNDLTDIRGGAGIDVFDGTNVSVRANSLATGTQGVEVYWSRNVTLTENTFDRNTYLGAEVTETAGGHAYHNNFIRSGWSDQYQARGDAGVAWDDGYPSGGNYWSDYKGVDANHDGIGDTAYVFAQSGGTDRYPLILPWGRPAVPPVARIDVDNATPMAGQTVDFGGTASSDDDGSILSYNWDFGDGGSGTGSHVHHGFAHPGTHVVTLTVRDNSGLTNSTAMTIAVSVPPGVPTASFEVLVALPLYPNVSADFDARASWTRYGTITSWAWNFGDGTSGSGERVLHAFNAPGTFVVRLTVANAWGVSAWTSHTVTVTPIPDIPLVLYSHPSGFRLPVPETWDLSEDMDVGDTTIDLVLRGPVHGYFQTNILVDSTHDPTVRENPAYMESLVDGVLDDLREDDPHLVVIEAPVHRTISGHAGMVFAVQHRSGTLVTQKAALVVSEAHQKAWFLILSASIDRYVLYNATFDRMVDGFEITATPTALLVLAFAVVAAVVAAVVLLAYFRWRRRSARTRASLPRAPPGLGGPGPGGLASAGTCVRCGTRYAAVDFYCPECGTSTRGAPPSPGRP